MQNPLDFLKRPVVVVGMGLSGEAALRLLKRNGVKAVSFDDKPGMAEFHQPEVLLEKVKPATLVVSPGYPLAKPWIRDFVDQGGQITSELALAVQFLTSERVIGVTGSVGKSTTVSILNAALEKFSPASFVGGNIGRPLADYIVDLQEMKRPLAPWVVLELSSYQLENCGSLRCEISAITHLTANHMERYDSLQHYYDTKWQLIKITSHAAVLNKNGGDLQKYAKGKKEDIEIWWTDQGDEDVHTYHLDQAALLGSHNQDNLALSAKIAKLAGWPAAAFDGMREFPGLAHRMENLGKRKDILFVNDSKATTMESVKTAALGIYDRMDRKSQLVLLLGGKDKNLPWEELAVLKKIQKLRPIFFGAVAERAHSGSGLEGPICKTLGEALALLPGIAQKGDTVLLSPGGTSLDEFKNFEERGKFFQEKVQSLF